MKALLRWHSGLWGVLLFLSACSMGTDEELSLEPIQVPMRSDQSLETPPTPQLERDETAVPEPGKKPAREAQRKKAYLYQGQEEFDPELRGPDFPEEASSLGASWETVHARDKDLVLANFGVARFDSAETSRVKFDPNRYLVPKISSRSVAEAESLDPEYSRQKKPLIFRSRSAGFASHPEDLLLAYSFPEQADKPEVSEEIPDTRPRRKITLLLKADDDRLDLLNGDATINTHRYRQRAGK